MIGKSIKSKIIFLATICFVFFGMTENAWALPAFPGAEGQGASTTGGRGGTVYVVDTLSDNPADGLTFREAVTASGPRIVTFAVSGHIRLTTTLSVNTPYLTIAGQTSPGGVDVSGGMFMVSTHDVLVMHMRFRMASDVCDTFTGSQVGNCETYGDAVRVMGAAYSGDRWAHDVVFDHCSMSWGNDETLDIAGYGGKTTDVTISNCLIAQGLDDPAPETNHGYGIGIGGHFQNLMVTNVSLHHNYIAHFRLRMPLVSYNGFGDLRNNVMYNWGSRGAVLMDERNADPSPNMTEYNLTRVNAVNNHFKTGSLGAGLTCGSNASGIVYYGGDRLSGSTYDCISLTSNWARGQFYETGNTGCGSGRVWQGYSGVQCTAGNGFFAPSWLDLVDPDYLAAAPYVTNDIQVTTSAMNDGYASTILAGAGATKCQSGPCRDSVDTQFVADYSNNTGSTLPDCHFPSTGCTFPTFSNPQAPTDSDSDGMADSWEQSKFGNLDRNGTGDADNDGYTDLEEYLHELGGYATASQSEDTTPPVAPQGLSVN